MELQNQVLPLWENRLRQSLRCLENPEPPSRIAIVGIGNELLGDDAVGVLAARELSERLRGCESVLVIDAGAAPENCTGTLRKFSPDLILLLDAAQMNVEDPADVRHRREVPGTTRWLEFQDMLGLCASTHTLPPSILAEYLAAELKCEIILLGVQPRDTSFGAALSQEAFEAVKKIVRELEQIPHLLRASASHNPRAEHVSLPV